MPITIDSDYGLDISSNDTNTDIFITVLDQGDQTVESDVSNNDEIVLSTLSDIKSTVNSLAESSLEVTPELSLFAVGLSGSDNAPFDGYFVMYGSNEFIYIPIDKLEYLSVKDNGEIINLSSNTISCYSFDSSGNTVNQFRFPSFATCQKYTYYSNQYNSWWQWDNISIYDDDSNITFGQTGINNIDSFFLFGILVFVAFIALFKKGR